MGRVVNDGMERRAEDSPNEPRAAGGGRRAAGGGRGGEALRHAALAPANPSHNLPRPWPALPFGTRGVVVRRIAVCLTIRSLGFRGGGDGHAALTAELRLQDGGTGYVEARR